ncbi:MAG: hypothetical protein H6731_06470 [Myxococcales bacterium]|nr:MAG: hypothetical protein H6731_06470 [Myxococcales bacterium]
MKTNTQTHIFNTSVLSPATKKNFFAPRTKADKFFPKKKSANLFFTQKNISTSIEVNLNEEIKTITKPWWSEKLQSRIEKQIHPLSLEELTKIKIDNVDLKSILKSLSKDQSYLKVKII